MFKKISIISNFNVENFKNILSNFKKNYNVKTFSNSLIISDLKKNKNSDLIIVLIDKNNRSDSFKKFFFDYVKRNKNIIFFFIQVPISQNQISAPILQLKKKDEINDFKELASTKNFYLIDYNNLVNRFNEQVFNYKRWFQTKIPFTVNFESFLVKELYDLINLTEGKRKKAIFFDLDDTIWGGTLAEDGQKKLLLGGINGKGEAFLSFQKILMDYKNSGIILGVISRNDEKKALKAIETIPNMQIRKKDLAGWKINFENKSQNILKLAKELRINPDSIVFIDNSIYERQEVKQKIQGITVPEIPDGLPYELCGILQKVSNLNYIKLNREDLIRNESIQNLKKINKSKKYFNDHSEWLKSLKIKIIFENFNLQNIERIHQMYQRINQMNLSTRRLTLSQIQKENQSKLFNLITISVKDSIADLGMIALLSYEKRKDKIIIKDFLFSCRALGRDIESFLIRYLIYNLKKKGYKEFLFDYKKTEKNMLCRNFLKKHKIEKKGKFYSYNGNFKNSKNQIFKLILKDKIF